MSNLPDGDLVRAVAEIHHSKPEHFAINNRLRVVVADGAIHEFNNPFAETPDALSLSTLSAIRDYWPHIEASEENIVQVVDPTTVRIVAPVVGELRQQFVYATSSPLLPRIVFGQYLDAEGFIIQLQSAFVQTAERDNLLKFIGSLRAVRERETADDGISQQVTVKAGVTRVNEAVAQPIWHLAAYRTFSEVEQPTTPLLVRLRQDDKGAVGIALFEADGGAWRTTAVANIGAWLRDALGEGVTVLA